MNGRDSVRYCKTVFAVAQGVPVHMQALSRISITSALLVIQICAANTDIKAATNKAVLTNLNPTLRMLPVLPTNLDDLEGNTFEIDNAKSLYLRAVAMEEGSGLPRDQKQAVELYREAAEQHYEPAEYDLALLYEEGRGVTKDFAEAAKWYRAASEQGDAAAQNNLGRLYALGRGVPEDAQQAAYWYRKAADQENQESQNNLANFYREGRGVSKDLAKALELYRLAAMSGYAPAQNNLGLMYANGSGTELNYCIAYAWLSLAATKLPSSEKLLEQLRSRMKSEELHEAERLRNELRARISSASGVSGR